MSTHGTAPGRPRYASTGMDGRVLMSSRGLQRKFRPRASPFTISSHVKWAAAAQANKKDDARMGAGLVRSTSTPTPRSRAASRERKHEARIAPRNATLHVVVIVFLPQTLNVIFRLRRRQFSTRGGGTNASTLALTYPGELAHDALRTRRPSSCTRARPYLQTTARRGRRAAALRAGHVGVAAEQELDVLARVPAVITAWWMGSTDPIECSV